MRTDPGIKFRELVPTPWNTFQSAEPARARAGMFTMRGEESGEILAAAMAALLDYCESKDNLADARVRFMDLVRDRGDIETFKEAARFYSVLVTESRNYFAGLRTLDSCPAQEYYQAFVSRGVEFWNDRWSAAGGQLFDGRMIALKGDPVWSRLSIIGLPHPRRLSSIRRRCVCAG